MIPLDEFGPFLRRLMEIRTVVSQLDPPVGANY
jgi:hypothetical protein